MDRLNMRVVEKILRYEWKEFEEDQDLSILAKTNRRSGTLRNEHNDRKYSVVGGHEEVKGQLVHPDYERYLDMTKDRLVSKVVARAFRDKDRLVRRKSKRTIHNKIIFGRLNPITFKLMDEMRVGVREEVRSGLSSWK